jgi:hypothetical protein
MFWRQLLDLLLGILKTQIYLNRDFRLDSVFKFYFYSQSIQSTKYISMIKIN